jgi:hypothetical protein
MAFKWTKAARAKLSKKPEGEMERTKTTAASEAR